MAPESGSYIPALRFDALTRFFDPVVRFTTRESEFKRLLIDQAELKENARVLDVGCGTATLAVMLKRRHPRVEVAGIDGDAKILEIAKSKVKKENLEIELHQALSDQLPFDDNSFDCCFSTLFFHHLRRDNKIKTLQEIARVLRPSAGLQIADFGKPQNIIMEAVSLPIRLVDGLSPTSDNFAGRLPELIEASGFGRVEEVRQFTTIAGPISIYSARRQSKPL